MSRPKTIYKIYEVRDQHVMLDFDFTDMYGVEVKVLNQTMKCYIERFIEYLIFWLTRKVEN